MWEDKVFSYLPSDKKETVKTLYLAEKKRGEVLSELRLRTGYPASLTFFGEGKCRNRLLPFSLSNGEMREVFSRVCGGSLYAFEESIKEGFLSVDGGIRVGIGGRAVVKSGEICSLSSLASLVFRIPHDAPHFGERLAASFLTRPRGMLLFSPPSCGKTTLLRSFVGLVSHGKSALRTCVIDTRGELSSFPLDALVDILSGYPKRKGAEIAVRTLSPEVLVMDEVGADEVCALLSLAALGVPLVASAHGGSAEEIRKSSLGALIEKGVFVSLWDVKENKEIVL